MHAVLFVGGDGLREELPLELRGGGRVGGILGLVGGWWG